VLPCDRNYQLCRYLSRGWITPKQVEQAGVPLRPGERVGMRKRVCLLDTLAHQTVRLLREPQTAQRKTGTHYRPDPGILAVHIGQRRVLRWIVRRERAMQVRQSQIGSAAQQEGKANLPMTDHRECTITGALSLVQELLRNTERSCEPAVGMFVDPLTVQHRKELCCVTEPITQRTGPSMKLAAFSSAIATGGDQSAAGLNTKVKLQLIALARFR
jgi:hypothetical protein